MEGKISKSQFNQLAEEFIVDDPADGLFVNFLANDQYGLYLSATLGGYSFSRSGQLLTKVSQSQAETDRPGRFFYLRDHDSGQIWNIGYQPTVTPLDHFQARHRIGSTTVASVKDQLSSQLTVFVPPTDPIEIWQIKLSNNGRAKRRFSVFWALEWASQFDECHHSQGTLLAKSRQLPKLGGFMSFDRPADSFETDAEVFFGRWHGYQNPQALESGRLSRSQGPFARGGVGVLEKKITLGPNASFELTGLAGLVESGQPATSAKALIGKYSDAKNREAALQRLTANWQAIGSRHIISSPQKDLDRRYNAWASYQGHQSSRWPGLNRYGQPDPFQRLSISQLGDHLIGALVDQPTLAKEYLDRLVSHQRKDGSLLENWDPDSSQYNAPSVAATITFILTLGAYLNETGQLTELKVSFPYLDGGNGTLLEHLNRAIKYLTEQLSARHLLQKDRESILETCQLIYAWREILPVLAATGDHHQSRFLLELIEKVSIAVNAQWAGQGFPRQLTPQKIGFPKERFRRLDLETQIWAIISQTATSNRAAKCLTEIKKQLGTVNGYVDFAPTYSAYDSEIPASADWPGSGQNGSISLKNNLLLAKAWFNQKDADNLIKQLGVESFLIPETVTVRPGLASQAVDCWGAAVAGWWEKIVLENVAGITATLGGLKISPCLPRDWRNLEINRFFRGAEYHIRIRNPLGQSHTVDRIVVDGARLTGNVIRPFQSGSHFVEVFLG